MIRFMHNVHNIHDVAERWATLKMQLLGFFTSGTGLVTLGATLENIDWWAIAVVLLPAILTSVFTVVRIVDKLSSMRQRRKRDTDEYADFLEWKNNGSKFKR